MVITKDVDSEAICEEACCAVCLLELSGDGTAMVRTACGHDFHLCCLLKCMEYQGTGCPICRQSIDAELADAPRSWISSMAARGVSRPSSQGLMATEAAVAVEIAESVRRSLADEHEELADSALSVAAAAALRARAGRLASNGGAWDFPGDFRWYSEIVEAVARSLAEEAQRPGISAMINAPGSGAHSDAAPPRRLLTPWLPERRDGDGFAHDFSVDPGALAGLEEAVGRLHDVSYGSSSGRSALQRRMLLGVDPEALAGVEEAVGRLHNHGASATAAAAVARRRAAFSPASRSLPPQPRAISLSRSRSLPQQPEDQMPVRFPYSPRQPRPFVLNESSILASATPCPQAWADAMSEAS